MNSSRRWAPWWAYLVPFLVLDNLRQLALPHGTVPTAIDVVLAVAIGAVVVVVATTIHRAR